MRKSLFVVMAVLLTLGLTLPLGAQDATPEPTAEVEMTGTAEATGDDMGAMMTDPAVTVTDQAVLNGMVTISNIDSPAAGFVAIHSDMDGMPGHVVGVAPVPQGATENLAVLIDGAMATPLLHAQLHVDDNTPGVFEFEDNPSADVPVSQNYTSFMIEAIFAFDQQPIENTVIVASTISNLGGWLVIHSDNNGSPGPVLGQALINAGTTPAVIVPLAAEGQTAVLWPMLHVDDNEVGTYEFGQVEGADSPIRVGDQVVTRPFNVTEAPTLLLADGTPLQSPAVPVIVPAMDQTLDTNAPASGELMLERVLSVGPGIIDVHADMGGHPAVSLGVLPVPDGESANVAVPLRPPPVMPDMPVTPIVWPMLHRDTNANGVYEYLRIVGQDLPVVYNGAIVTVPVMVGDGATTGGDMMATDEAGMMMTDEAGMMTPEATPAG